MVQKLSPPQKQDVSGPAFWKWLYLLWKRSTGSGEITVDQLSPEGGSANQIIKVNAGTSAFEFATLSGTSPINVSFGTGSVAIVHSTSGVVAGTYGNATQVGRFAVNTTGHITAGTNVPITGADGNFTVQGVASILGADTLDPDAAAGQYFGNIADGGGFGGRGWGMNNSTITSAVVLSGSTLYIGLGTGSANSLASRVEITSAGVVTINGRVLVADGNTGLPGVAFSANPDSGMSNLSGQLRFSSGANFCFYMAATEVGIPSDSAVLTMGGFQDVRLAREAANILAQRNGTNAQAFRLYSTFSDASNYERLRISGGSGSAFLIRSESSGSGTNRDLEIGTEGAGNLYLAVGASGRWFIASTGDLRAVADNTYDIGAAGATRPRDLFVARNVAISGTMGTLGNIHAKGDLLVGTATAALSRLAAGTDGSGLIADASTATGLRWAAYAATAPILVTTGTGTANIAFAHSTSGVTPGTYGGTAGLLQIVVNTYGHVTAAVGTAAFPSADLSNLIDGETVTMAANTSRVYANELTITGDGELIVPATSSVVIAG